MKPTNTLAALAMAVGITAVWLAGLLAVLMPSCALAKFGAPIILSEAGQHAINPEVAMNAAGDAVIVWQRSDQNHLRRIQARSRSAAGTFGPVQTLSVAGSSAVNPQVAIDGEGDAVIVWETTAWTRTIQLRTRSRTGALGPIQTVGRGGSLPAQVASDADGDSVVIWQNSLQERELQARRVSKAGMLGPILTISNSALGVYSNLPRLALDPDGDALIVWEEWGLPGGPQRILARALTRTGLLGPIQRLSGDRDAGYSEVAMDRDGNALVVWANSDFSSIPRDWIQSRARSNAGVLGPIQTLIANQSFLYPARRPEIAMDADGDALVVWSSEVANDILIQARARSRAGVYGGIATLSATGRDPFDAFGPQVAMDADGDAVIVWQRTDRTGRFATGRTRSKAGAYGPGQTLSASALGDLGQRFAQKPRVAMSGNGTALVVWARSDGTNLRIEAAVGP